MAYLAPILARESRPAKNKGGAPLFRARRLLRPTAQTQRLAGRCVNRPTQSFLPSSCGRASSLDALSRPALA